MKNLKKKLFLQKSFSFDNSNDSHSEIEGLGLVYSTPDSVGDTFDKNIKINFGYDGRPVDLLYNHNHDDIYASTRNNTLSFERTSEGLKFKSLIDKSDKIFKKIKSGLIDGTSFGFLINDYEENDFGGYNFTDISVYELSLTWEPAHVGTSVQTKNLSQNEVIDNGEFVSSILDLQKSFSSEKDEEETKEDSTDDEVLNENDSKDVDDSENSKKEEDLEKETKSSKNSASKLTLKEELVFI